LGDNARDPRGYPPAGCAANPLPRSPRPGDHRAREREVIPMDEVQVERVRVGTVRVLIVDDQVAFRRAAQAVVESADSFVVVGAVESAEEGLAAVDHLRPHLVLMDVNLPGIDGLEASRRLRESHPSVKVILLSSYDEAEFADLTADCGAAAYVPKAAFGPDRLDEIWAGIAGSRRG
jgi:CheY-like chemotaxis protein